MTCLEFYKLNALIPCLLLNNIYENRLLKKKSKKKQKKNKKKLKIQEKKYVFITVFIVLFMTRQDSDGQDNNGIESDLLFWGERELVHSFHLYTLPPKNIVSSVPTMRKPGIVLISFNGHFLFGIQITFIGSNT
jgi:hypothetical protein